MENSFGIMAARWRIFRTPMEYSPAMVEKICLACVALHNFLRDQDEPDPSIKYLSASFVDQENANGQLLEGGWRTMGEKICLI